MKLVYGISRWTNSSRASARHIATSENKPLCGGGGRKIISWEIEEGKPTCNKYIKIIENHNSEQSEQAISVLHKLEDALESLRQRIESANPELFNAMEQTYIKEIKEIKNEIDKFTNMFYYSLDKK